MDHTVALAPFNPRYAPLVASWIPDATALREVDPMARGAVSPDMILRWMEVAEHPFMLLPEPDAAPIGYGELSWPRKVPGLYARHVLVDPRERGKGYGWTLIERLGHVAHARFSEERLNIQIEASHVTALALLNAMGFAELGPVTLMPNDGGMSVAALDLSARLPFTPHVHRESTIPTPGDEPGYGRGLRWV